MVSSHNRSSPDPADNRIIPAVVLCHEDRGFTPGRRWRISHPPINEQRVALRPPRAIPNYVPTGRIRGVGDPRLFILDAMSNAKLKEMQAKAAFGAQRGRSPATSPAQPTDRAETKAAVASGAAWC